MSDTDWISCPFCRSEIDYSFQEVMNCGGCGAFIDAVETGDTPETIGALRRLIEFAFGLKEQPFPTLPAGAITRDAEGNPVKINPQLFLEARGLEPSAAQILILSQADELKSPPDETPYDMGEEESEEPCEAPPPDLSAMPVTLIVLLKR